jgi:hypothetical protein
MKLLAVFTSIKNQLEIFTKTLLNYYNALKYALKKSIYDISKPKK